MENAKKDFDKFLKRKQPMEQKLQENPNYLQDLEKEIQELKSSLEN